MSFSKIVPLDTLTHTCGNSVETLADVTDFVAQVTVGNKHKNVSGLFLSCDSNNIRVAWGVDPTQAGVGHILVEGTYIYMTGLKRIKELRFINSENGVNAIISITPEYS